MKKPTARQLYLMRYAGPPHSFWRISEGGTSNIIRHYEYARGGADRQPSARETEALKLAGWIELRPDVGHDTRNSETNEVTCKAYRVWLTAAGQKVLTENSPRS